MRLKNFVRRRSLSAFFRVAMQYFFGKRGQRRLQGWRLFYRLRYEGLIRSPEHLSSKISRFFAVRVWVDREAFPRIQKLFTKAQHTIFIQMFIWKDDDIGRRMAGALIQAADRGVKVQINKEALGDVFEMSRDFLATKRATDGVWHRFWHHPNIRITYGKFNDHAKVYLIDDRILLLTGMNIADEYNGPWHDYLIELRGRQFVEHYLTQGEVRPAGHYPVRLVMNGETRREIRPVMMELLHSAQRSIIAEHCYVSDKQVLDLLIQKSKQGVRVTLILPSKTDLHHYTNKQTLLRLLSEGDERTMDIFLYPAMFHGKIILVDHARAFLGSANLMTSSIDEMGEVNVLLEGKVQRPILKLRDILRADVLQSRPVTGAPSLSWIGRWLAWLQV